MRALITLVIPLLLLWGCNSTQVQELPPPPINLAQHPQLQAQPVESLEEIFALTSTMKAQLNNAFATRSGNLSATKRLMMLILENGDKSVRYQSGATLTAAQTYKQLNANCLSLSILAFSMAEHLGLQGQFQRVHIPEYWALNRGYNLLTGHINLRLYTPRRHNDVYELYNAEREVTVDFAPDLSGSQFKITDITKERVAAMFYNNKGATALVEQDYERAYSYFYAATQMDPYYSGGWGNLGILYRLLNDFERAERVYQYAINIDKDNNTALGNLAILYRHTGREQQAKEIEHKLAQMRKDNPYYHIALGNDSLVQKQYVKALNHFRKARELDERIHESYFGMAHTYYLMGDIKATRRYLLMAQKRAQFDYDKLRYRGKLASLELIANNR